MHAINHLQTPSLLQQVKPGTKILFASVPADGHFNPLTGFAKHLKDIGCDVRWYTSSHYVEKVNRIGIQLYPLKKALDLQGGLPEEIFPDRASHKSQVSKLIFDLIHVFIYRGPEYFEDILDIYEDFPFELMVADVTFGAIPIVKEKLNIPVIGIGIVPLTETSKELPPAGLGLTPSNGFFGKRKQAILRFLSDQLIFRKPNKVLREVMAEYEIDTKGLNIFDFITKSCSFLLQSGTPGFEYRRSDLGSNIRYVGPLLPYSPKKETKAWYDERVKEYNKVILLTQGTVEKDASKLIVPTLEAFKNTDTLVIVTTGGSRTKELKEEYNYHNIIIEDFIPFHDVMAYASVYVTNGGYGGVLLSIQNNLPMVVAGIHEGKIEINARVGYFGLGINLRTENPSPKKIRRAVHAVLNEDQYRRNVCRLNSEFHQYDPARLCTHYAAQLLKQKKTERKFFSSNLEPVY